MAKHLSLDDRITIQNKLANRSSLSEIAKILSRDISTIRKEIVNHRQCSKKTGPYVVYNNCVNKQKCPYPKYCEKCNKTIKKCRRCTNCNDLCSKYEPETCKHRDKKPYCCNGCPSRNNCRLMKYYYEAEVAQKEYEKTLSESRLGYNITPEELDYLSKTVEDLVKNKGQSIVAAYNNNPDLFTVCPKTVYNYVDAQLLTTKNIDLPKKVRFAPRKKKPQHKVDRKCRDGRTFVDFTNFLDKNPGIDVVEVDTVEGKKGEECLLTIFFKSCSLQLAFIREVNTARSVKEIFDDIYLAVGHEKFTQLFPSILEDNGHEFSDPVSIENYITYEEETREQILISRTKVFYCDSYSSYQKGSCERNHEFIRLYIPKGTSFKGLTQQDINLMMNHINSYPRGEKKNLMVPTQRFIALYGSDTAEKLNIKLIDPNQVTLNKSIFKK